MSQNRSSAVMQQRREPHDSLEDFPTPPWATRALCHLCEWIGGLPPDQADCRDPAANRGYMVYALREFFATVHAADIHDYGAGFAVEDYLFGPLPSKVDWTITNPPFRLAEQFIERACETSTVGVGMFVRTSFLEGEGRFKRLFRKNPPTHVLQFAERVVIHKGRIVDPDVKERVWSEKKGDWIMKKPSTATSYCWLVWETNNRLPPKFGWIPPCRKRLTLPGDYSLPVGRR